MTTKIKVNKIVEAMKAAAKVAKSKPTVKVEVKTASGIKIRDMRDDARELGSHGAKEFFGEQTD